MDKRLPQVAAEMLARGGRMAEWGGRPVENVSQRNICRLMWWKDRGMLESGCPGLAISPRHGLQQVSLFPFVLVFICKIGIKLPLTSHRLVEGLKWDN